MLNTLQLLRTAEAHVMLPMRRPSTDIYSRIGCDWQAQEKVRHHLKSTDLMACGAVVDVACSL